MAMQGENAAAAPPQWSSGITPQATPAATPVPGSGPADGRSPNAKRPLNRETIAMSVSEVKQMSGEDLAAGLNTLYMNQQRDQKWSNSIAESVHYNAQMLDGVITRLNSIEAAAQLLGTNVENIDGKVNKLGENAANMLEKVNEQDIKRDSDLRQELNQMAEKLEQGHEELKKLMQQSTAVNTPVPGVPPGLDFSSLDDNIRKLGKLNDENAASIQKLGQLNDVHVGRLTVLEGKAEATQAAVEAMHMEVEGVKKATAAGARSDPWAAAAAANATAGANTAPGAPTLGTQHFFYGTAPSSPAAGPGGDLSGEMCGSGLKWRLYDEKWIFAGDGKYSASKPLTWLKEVRNYLAGRCSDMDPLLDWIERQENEIDDNCPRLSAPMINHAPGPKEVSKQMWALLGHLLKNDATQAGLYANVPRHNGFEAWRAVSGPILEDRAMIRKSLLSKVTNPTAAGNIDRVEQAIVDWKTTCRLYAEADGPPQDEEARRIALVGMLPQDMYMHITMLWELPQYKSYVELEKYILKYCKTLKNNKHTARPVHAVDEQPAAAAPPPPEPDWSEEDLVEHERLMSELMSTSDEDRQLEILAVMRNRGFRPPTRGQGGQRQRQPAKPAAATYMPPRGRQDISCVNCGGKGHAAPDCPEPQRDKADRPCFKCHQKGHESRNCPNKDKVQRPGGGQGRRPVKMIQDAGAPALVAAVTTSSRPLPQVLCVIEKVALGVVIVANAAKKEKNGRYKLLTPARLGEPEVSITNGRFAALAESSPSELTPKEFTARSADFPKLAEDKLKMPTAGSPSSISPLTSTTYNAVSILGPYNDDNGSNDDNGNNNGNSNRGTCMNAKHNDSRIINSTYGDFGGRDAEELARGMGEIMGMMRQTMKESAARLGSGSSRGRATGAKECTNGMRLQESELPTRGRIESAGMGMGMGMEMGFSTILCEKPCVAGKLRPFSKASPSPPLNRTSHQPYGEATDEVSLEKSSTEVRKGLP